MTIDAWWFCDESRKLPHGDGRKVVVGKTLKVKGPPVLCKHGLHASRRLIDALEYAPGPILCRVRLGGEIVEGDDKLCATERTVLSMSDATELLHRFACAEAKRALLKYDKNPDLRSLNAIEVKLKWLRGEATDDELDAARAAAWAAARDAARDAAWNAARGAAWNAARGAARAAARNAAWNAARDAAWNAARGAAWNAARGAARNAAWNAARDAAWNAARDAAWNAAWDEQNRRLTDWAIRAIKRAEAAK